MNINHKQTLIATFSVLAVLALVGGCGGGGGGGGGGDTPALRVDPLPDIGNPDISMFEQDQKLDSNQEKQYDFSEVVPPESTLQARSSDTSVANTEVDGDTLRVIPGSSGRAIITAFVEESPTLGASANGLAPRETEAKEEILMSFVVEVEDFSHDLAIFAEPVVSLTEVEPGAKFDLSVVVRNNGTRETAEDATITYYQSGDGAIDDSSDTPVGDPGTHTVEKELAVDHNTNPHSTSVTAPTRPGIYYYGACVSITVDESETDNNCSPGAKVEVKLSSPPLTVEIENPDIVGISPGGTFQLSYTVTVGSKEITDNIDTSVYTDASPDTTVTELPISGPGLAANEEHMFNREMTAPLTEGLYYYEVCAKIDSYESCDKIDVAVREAGTPALIAHTPTASLEAGGNIALGIIVKNVGDTDTAEDITVTWFAADQPSRDTRAEIGQMSTIIGGLMKGKESPASTKVTTPGDIPGTYFFGGCAKLVIGETVISENCSVGVEVTVLAVPDLVISEAPMVSSHTVNIGGDFTLSVIVSNKGDATTETVALTYYRSTNDTIDPTTDTDVGTDTVIGGIEGDEDAPPELISLIAPPTPATWYYGACVAPVTGETDKANCSIGVPVVVTRPTAPDLVISAKPTVSPSTVNIGRDFTLSVIVRNNSDSQITDDVDITYYRSNNGIISALDTEVGTDTVPGGIEIRDDASVTASLPAPITPGTYYYGACVTPTAKESNTANNCSTWVAVTVNAAPPDPEFISITSPPPIPPEIYRISETYRVSPGGKFTLDYTVTNTDESVITEVIQIAIYTGMVPEGSSTQVLDAGGTIPAGFAVGASRTFNDEIMVSDKVGLYYYVVEAEFSDDVDRDEYDGVLVLVQNEDPATPELVAYATTASPTTVVPGADIMLSVRIGNIGQTITNDITVDYFQDHHDSSISGDVRTKVGTTTISGGLNENEERIRNITVSAPSKVGYYSFYGCASSVSGETVTDDNCSEESEVEVAESDLVISATPWVSSSYVTTGVDFALGVVVRNNGGATTETADITYYRSTDNVIGDSDDLMLTTNDAAVSSGLAAATDAPIDSIVVTAPATSGTYYYGACVSTVTDESNITNNCSDGVKVVVDTPSGGDEHPLQAFIILPLENLMVVSPGEDFTLAYTVENTYNMEIDGTIDVGVQVFTLSTPPAGESQSFDGFVDVPGTDSTIMLPMKGDSETIRQTITVSNTPGLYVYQACSAITSMEDSEICDSKLVQVFGAGTPELIAYLGIVSDTVVTAGDDITLSIIVENIGNVPTPEGEDITVTYFYYTYDHIGNTRTRTIVGGSSTIKGLAAQESAIRSITVPTPSVAGTYDFGGCASTVAGETSTTDNCSFSGTEVVVSGDHPLEISITSPSENVIEVPPGGTFELTYTVENTGNTMIVQAIADVYTGTLPYDRENYSSSSPIIYDSFGINPGEFGLKIGEPKMLGNTITVPSISGLYYYDICARIPGSGDGDTCKVVVVQVPGEGI